MIEKNNDPIPRLKNAIPIHKHPIRFIPSKIEDIDFTIKKSVTSQDLLIQWKSHTLNPFTPLDVVKVEGCKYTNAFSSVKPRDDEGLPRIRDLFLLILPLLYPSSTFPYNALFDFPENRSLFSFQRDGVAFLLKQKNALFKFCCSDEKTKKWRFAEIVYFYNHM